MKEYIDGVNSPVSVEGLTFEEGNLNVLVGDQTTRPLDLYFLNALAAPTTLATETAVDDRTITVTSAAGASVGDYLGIFEDSNFYFGTILSISSNDITLDTPLDSVFSVGSTTAFFSRDLNVDASTGNIVYDVEVGSGGTSSIDITRLILMIQTDGTGSLSLGNFGNIAGGLTNGIVLRRANGIDENIFNLKTNGDLVNVCYDVQTFSTGFFATNDGLAARITFAGQSKHGVSIRLDPGDKLEIILQDDLSSLTQFRVIAQGHFTTETRT